MIKKECIECNEKGICDTCPLMWDDDFNEKEFLRAIEKENRIKNLLEMD